MSDFWIGVVVGVVKMMGYAHKFGGGKLGVAGGVATGDGGNLREQFATREEATPTATTKRSSGNEAKAERSYEATRQAGCGVLAPRDPPPAKQGEDASVVRQRNGAGVRAFGLGFAGGRPLLQLNLLTPSSLKLCAHKDWQSGKHNIALSDLPPICLVEGQALLVIMSYYVSDWSPACEQRRAGRGAGNPARRLFFGFSPHQGGFARDLTESVPRVFGGSFVFYSLPKLQIPFFWKPPLEAPTQPRKPPQTFLEVRGATAGTGAISPIGASRLGP